MNSNISTNLLNELDNILKEHDNEILQKISKHYSIDINELNKLFNNNQNDIIVNEERIDISKDDSIVNEERIDISKDYLKKMKINELKNLCKKHKLKSSGNKDILIDRIYTFNTNDC